MEFVKNFKKFEIEKKLKKVKKKIHISSFCQVCLSFVSRMTGESHKQQHLSCLRVKICKTQLHHHENED